MTQPGNEQQTITVSAAAAAEAQAKVEAAFTSMGQAMLALVERQKEHAVAINQMIADRNQQLEIIGTLLKQVETLVERHNAMTKLVDSDHAAVEVLMTVQGLNGKAANC